MTKDWKKFYDRIKVHQHNVNFSDFVRFIEFVGFVFHHQTGSHKFFKHPQDDVINIQEYRNEAKPVQIKNLIEKIKEYNLMDKV